MMLTRRTMTWAFVLVCCFVGKVTAQTGTWKIETVLGNGKAELGLNVGDAIQVSVGEPFGVESQPGGWLYVTEVRNHRIWRVNLAEKKAQVVVGTGKKGYSGDGGPALQAELNEPYEVRFNRAGDMFFVEMKNHIVRKVNVSDNTITTIAGSGEAGFSGDGADARSAKLKDPHSIALSDDESQLYIADIGNHRIRKVDLQTGIIETIAGDGTQKLPVEGEVGLGKPVAGPRALFTKGDELWVALREGNSIWKMELKSGTWRHIAGTGKQGFSDGEGNAKKATMNGPKGLVVDQHDRVFVVDTENQVIRMVDTKQNKIETIAGMGPSARGFAVESGNANEAKLDRPHGIGIDEKGTLFIGDTNNHRTRAISLQ